ncbi:uncharacterized protein LOC127101500 [Lathyrus oleraceus]|uniref:uncharacterized protein LOC127101500 n=1 Tax=Pisum sativum TaxID=3888 RepID=UPI0021D07607|nr:uncharacterized protein LOC127101500 [Pisum sativum]
MDSRRRNTHQFRFKCPKLKELRKLGSLRACPSDFKDRYGRILTMLSTNVEDGVLNTVVQFYDSAHRCFTFPDYHLAPTLKEYFYYIGLPVSDQISFSGLPIKFLMKKAVTLASVRSMVAFEVVLTLLIYGIVLFPNVDNFVGIDIIHIFLIRNPVPTLLVDTYYSIHDRTEKSGGIVMCCAPLLYKWSISHLPQSSLFKDKKKCLRWSQRIMSLTNADVTWYSRVYDDVKIIDSCGFFIQEGVYSKGLKDKIVNALHKIHRKGKDELGNKDCVSLESYTQWMQARATKIMMPYPPEEPLFPKVIGHTLVPG